MGDVGVHAEPMRRGTRFRSIPATESVFPQTGTKHVLLGPLPPPTHISILRRRLSIHPDLIIASVIIIVMTMTVIRRRVSRVQ